MREPAWCAAVSHAPLVVMSLVLGILLIIVAYALREPEDARKCLRLAFEWFRLARPQSTRQILALSPLAPLPGSRGEASRGGYGTGERDNKAKLAAAYRRYFYDHPPLYKQVTLTPPGQAAPVAHCISS